MAFVVKIVNGSDIRRQRFQNSSSVGLVDINSFVHEAFAFDDYVLRYADDEGDLCILDAATFPDALELAARKQLLRLDVNEATHSSSQKALHRSANADGQHPYRDDAGVAAVPDDLDWKTCCWTKRWCKGIAAKGNRKGKGKFEGKAKSEGSNAGCFTKHRLLGRPRRLAFLLSMMRASEGNTLQAVSEMLIHWLPAITQHSSRRMEKITKCGPLVMEKIKPAVVALSTSAEDVPQLQHLAGRIYDDAADSASVDLGMLTVEFLKTLCLLDQTVQRKVVGVFVAALHPCLDELLDLESCAGKSSPTDDFTEVSVDVTNEEHPFRNCWKGKGKGKGCMNAAAFDWENCFWTNCWRESMAAKGKVKGKGKFKGKAESASTNDSRFTGGRQFGLPRRALFFLNAMQASEGVTPEAVSEMLIHWLPFLAQRATWRMEKITKFGPRVMDKMKTAVVAFATSAEDVPQLQHLVGRVYAAAADAASVDLGMLVVEVLNALCLLDQTVQRKVVGDFVAALLPCLHELLDMESCVGESSPTEVHHSVVCDGCQSSPLKGRRFSCNLCWNYDLCDECYKKKDQLHDASHDFKEVSVDANNEAHPFWNIWKGKGKGKGKKGWKGHAGFWC